MEDLTMIVPRKRGDHSIAIEQRANWVRALFEPLLAHQRILRWIMELKLGD